jgi:cell division protein ZapA (FtsZ GTPase activity inhibitor)
MGRLPSIQKPAASSSDPAQSAKAAAMKQAVPIRAEQKAEATPSSASVIEGQNPPATLPSVPLAQVPQPKPFNFARLFRKCKEAAEIVETAEWEEAGSRRDYDDEREDLLGEVTDPIDAAIQRLRTLCHHTTTTLDTRLQGINTLLDIVDLLNETTDMTEYFHFCEPQRELEVDALAAIKSAIETLSPQDRVSLFSAESFQDLEDRLLGNDELESWFEELKAN